MLFSYKFLIVSESPSPRLGRDILSKVHASVFINMEPSLSLPLIEQNVNPRVWGWWKIYRSSTKCYSCSCQAQRPALISTKQQYPLKPEIKEGLKPIIENLKEQGLLIPCNSPRNTPTLGVKKSNDKWWLIQDSWIINESVVPLHPMVPNP